MRILTTILLTIGGLLLGMLLAGGVEPLSAVTAYRLDQIYSRISHSESTRSIESYWAETGLGFKEVNQLISNEKCQSSDKYFKACLNSVVTSALNFNLKLERDGEFNDLIESDRLDEKNEKELLKAYLKISLNRYEVDFEKLLFELYEKESELKRSLLAAKMINAFYSVYYDPHTYILPANYYSEVSSKILRSKYFVGISYEKRNGDYFVKKVYKNSDADKSGLRLGDKILEINSYVLDGADYSEVSSILRDESIEFLKFKIERNKELLIVNLKRSFKPLSHVQYDIITADNKKYANISLTKFNFGACAEVASALEQVQKQNITGVVLDLRDNPGGQLNEASCLMGLFMGTEKKAYYVEYFDNKKPNEVVLTSDKQIYSGPLVVMINAGSASASELLAGALKEHGRAFVIGERTFGKGTFQEPESWSLNSKISLYRTQGLYLLPSRNSTQVVGVKPHIEVIGLLTLDKSESQVYFNPVPPVREKYKILNETKLNLQLCDKQKSVQIADKLLQKSLNYLDCERLGLFNTSKTTANSLQVGGLSLVKTGYN